MDTSQHAVRNEKLAAGLAGRRGERGGTGRTQTCYSGEGGVPRRFPDNLIYQLNEGGRSSLPELRQTSFEANGLR